jgi:3-dehydroquinate dehydratase-2
MTGKRSPEIYGNETLGDINLYIKNYAEKAGIDCDFFQTNFEGQLVEAIHSAPQKYDGIVLNAGAWTHYSYAVHDAVEAIELPVIETHMSDITKREDFRKKSVLTSVCAATVMGMGKDSYTKAIDLLREIIKK